MSSITIVGAGHVGVIYAAGLAELGHRVKVIDIDERRIARLRQGKIWFYEPGLPELVGRNVQRRRITFTSNYGYGLARAQFVFVCVPTPSAPDGSLDDRILRRAFDQIRTHAGRPAPIVINKSTVPVGTSDDLARLFMTRDMRVVSNPEFLAEGRAVDDFFHPTRIIIGSHDRVAAQAVAGLYAPLQAPVLFTDPVTSEFTKIAANAFLATKISFANLLSRIGEKLGANGEDVSKALSLDPRIGQGHLRAGLGFGGSCLPKDLAAMETLAQRFTGSPELFSAVAAVNRAQRTRIVDLLVGRFGALGGVRIAILGASFKANTDDLRESPALALARQLRELDGQVSIYDPVANGHLRALARGWLTVTRSAQTATRGADVLVVATEWPEFASLDFARVRSLMRGTLVVDGRGILNGDHIRGLGFDFFSFVGSYNHSEAVQHPAAVATA